MDATPRSEAQLAQADEALLDDFIRRISRPGDMSRAEQDAFIANPLVRSLGPALGIDVEALDAQHRDARDSAIATVTAAAQFARFGWAVSGRAPHRHAYSDALRVWDASSDRAQVDECLTRWWNDGNTYVRGTFWPMLNLSGRHEATHDMLLARHALLGKAVDHHERGEYEASVLIVLSQIDGLVLDLTHPPFGFFYEPRPDEFEDQTTVAGMPVVLRAVWRAVIKSANTTTMSDSFERSAIMHGRHLGFGTQTNSTKAFALFAAVVDWLRPKANEVTERWQAEFEARYTGSDERGEDGRRLDRRGFVETRDSLRWLAIRQANEMSQHGVYRSDLKLMFPNDGIGMMSGGMTRRDSIQLTVAPDGRAGWWAWAKTDSEFCFGIAGAPGSPMNSYYADVGPPGPPGEDPRWTDDIGRPTDWESA